jgi:hypothetical protein
MSNKISNISELIKMIHLKKKRNSLFQLLKGYCYVQGSNLKLGFSTYLFQEVEF